MSANEDLINFDLIETHKENIQQLPGGRSAKSLAKTLSPMPFGSSNEPTLDSTRTLNDAMRREYEMEIQNIAESDDPLDIYHRYVKWTLDAYPSAQATPQSQLLPLLERATKAFLSSAHYKNDPRYLKLWLHYIRWFSDAPRETFAYLARHSIGEGLASFYEEFAAWLEGAGRWVQAEEVYKLGIEKNARPVERLTRKYGQFQQRLEGRLQDTNEPTSPALPTVRPALAAKIDPFASTPRSDQQQPAQTSHGGAGAARAGKSKMAIFTDDTNATPPPLGAPTGGWESIGSLQDRKKENTVAPKPWAGETLKAGSRVGRAEKMSVFKDKTMRIHENKKRPASEAVVNPKTGKAERVFVNLEAVYPNPSNPSEEMSFDELRARHRGWSDKVWRNDDLKVLQSISGNSQRAQSTEEAEVDDLAKEFEQKVAVDEAELTQPSSQVQDSKPSKHKKLRVREVKQETQTVKTNLSSPTGPKIKRRMVAEPTMTFHSKAATNDVYDLFNQPLSCEASKEDSGESDLDDDGYSTTGDSTGTGMVSGLVSEMAVEEEEDTSASVRLNMANFASEENTSAVTEYGGEWTEFSTSKDVPHHQKNTENNNLPTNIMDSEDTNTFSQPFDETVDVSVSQKMPSHRELKTPVEAEFSENLLEEVHTRYVPIPPEDYDPNSMRPIRDQATTAQNRLPFMTPIVEKTESSLAANTMYQKPESDYFNSKTPSRSPKNVDSPSIREQILDTTPSQSPGSKNESPSNPGSDWNIFDKEDIFIQPSVTTPAKRALRLSLGEDENEKDTSPSPKRVQVVKTKEGKGLGLHLAEDPFLSPPKPAQDSPVKKRTASIQPVEFVKPALPVQNQPYTSNVTISSKPIIADLQCNPTDLAIRKQILDAIQPPLSSYPGFNHYPNENLNKYTQIQKFVKKVSADTRPKASPRKTPSKASSATTDNAPALAFPTTNRVYIIKRELGQGAFAPVYLAESTRPDEGAQTNNTSPIPWGVSPTRRGQLEAIKAECPPLQAHWEFHITRLLRSRLLAQPTPSRALASLIQAHELHAFADEAYLVLDYHPTGTLLDLVNLSRAANAQCGSRETGLDEPLAMLFTVEVLRVLEASFAVGVLHGDLKADNYLLRLPSIHHGGAAALDGPYDPTGANGWSGVGITLIDFGRGIDVHAFEGRVGFIADWDAHAATDAPEIRDKRPWVWSIDTWGAAGVVHSLLFGKYLDTVQVGGAAAAGGLLGAKGKKYRLKEPLKRYWQQGIWIAVFDALLNPAGIGMPSVTDDQGAMERFCAGLANVRGEMEGWLEREGERKGMRASLKRVEGLVRK